MKQTFRILKMSAYIIILLSLSFVFGLTLFFNFAPQIGATSDGERLERIKASPNYNGKTFINTLPTTLSNPVKIMSKVGRKFFFDTEGREPKSIINTYPMDLETFNQVPDTDFGVLWLGHSTLLVKFEGKVILFDPVFGERASMFSFAGPKRFEYTNRIEIKDLPKIDAVILSHDHYDHLDHYSIVELKDKVDRFYMPIGVGAHMEKWGLSESQIYELDWWDEIKYDENLKLVLTPTRHFSGRGFSDRNMTLWGSWVVEGKNKKIFFGGDSGYFPGFKEIGEKYGPFDLCFLECGAYNELWSEIHMMPEETAQAATDLNSSLLMPIHWGKFNLALHHWKEPVTRLGVKAEELNLQIATPEIGKLMIVSREVPQKKWWEAYE